MRTRFTIVRLTLGALLLAAAGLKLYGLGVSAVPQVGWFAQPWVQLAAAEWELILGLWLLSGSHQRGAWLAALVTFVAFAGVSGYLGFVGVASCGCFGTIQASPWWAFGVDVGVIALLLLSRPQPRDVASRPEAKSFSHILLGAALIFLLVTVVGSQVFGSPAVALAWFRGDVLVADTDVDLGSGPPGTVLEAQAVIHNTSAHEVVIIGGTSDCSCVTTSGLPLSIPPRGAVRLPIKLRIPQASVGRFTRTAQLRTDHERFHTVRLQLTCRVTE